MWLYSYQKYIFHAIFLIIFFTSFPSFSRASDICSKEGYTILIVNGILTNKDRAQSNKEQLERLTGKVYKNTPLHVEYLHNPSHLAGLGDIVDATFQKVMADDVHVDYDLTEILNDASNKVTTQKLLLVGHSQGNFYVNKFYDLVVDKVGGVPYKSLSVYGVATPASYVGGGGKYVTSNSDSLINSLRYGYYLDILPANIIIDLPKGDTTNGHSFTDNYLKYQGARIVSDIQGSLSGLKTNDVQDVNKPCIAPPELTTTHKIVGKVLAFADPTASVIKTTVSSAVATTYKVGLAIEHMLDQGWDALASLFSSPDKAAKNTGLDFSKVNSASASSADDTSKREKYANEDKSIPPVVVSLPENKTEEIFEQQNTAENIPVTNLPVMPSFMRIVNTGGGSPPPDPAPPDPTPPDPPPPDPEPTPDTTAPVINIIGNNPQVIYKNSTYTEEGATALDDIDGDSEVTIDGAVDPSTVGEYIITYTASDTAGNIANATRTVKVSSRIYIPQFSFGTGNGDGNDWQAWWFNGSELYNWVSEYVGNYLHEYFLIQNILGAHCTQCLQRGIFNHNPLLGFEASDVAISPFENSPQGNVGGSLYSYDMQWDATGYTYTIFDVTGGEVYDTAHTNVPGVGLNTWVGWDGSFNNFSTFPSGTWMGVIFPSSSFPWSQDLTGGSGMMLEPHPVYVP